MFVKNITPASSRATGSSTTSRYVPAGSGQPVYFNPMLRDDNRSGGYRKAIKKNIDRFKLATERAPHVVDLGAGTGVLSKMALDCGAERVTLVDVNKDLLDMASEALTQHGYCENKDFFIFHGSFTKMTYPVKIWDAVEPFDMLVSEILGTLTTSESMHEYIADALKHVQSFDGAQFVIPSKATQTLSICELSVVDENDLCARYPHDNLIPEWHDGTEVVFVPTNDLQLNNLHMKPFTVHSTATIRVDTFDVMSTTLPSVSLAVPSTLSWNHFLVLEWTCTLADGVELKNTLYGYKESPAVGVDRAVAWGFLLAECGPLYERCGKTADFEVTYPQHRKGWPRIILAEEMALVAGNDASKAKKRRTK